MTVSPVRRRIRPAVAVAAALLAAACADSINQRVPEGFGAARVAPGTSSAGWRVTDVRVMVPDSLTVSTDPRTRLADEDIVWWGDAGSSPAERREQVASIIGEAAVNGLLGLRGSRPVVAEVLVRRFHALTPRSRSSCSIMGCLGNTNIDFEITVRDAASGEVVATSGVIEADPVTVQGEAARAADARGETDRLRIIEHVAGVVRDWLASIA